MPGYICIANHIFSKIYWNHVYFICAEMYTVKYGPLDVSIYLIVISDNIPRLCKHHFMEWYFILNNLRRFKKKNRKQKKKGRSLRSDWEIKGWMTHKTSESESQPDRTGKEQCAAKWSATCFPYCSWPWSWHRSVHQQMGNYWTSCMDSQYENVVWCETLVKIDSHSSKIWFSPTSNTMTMTPA